MNNLEYVVKYHEAVCQEARALVPQRGAEYASDWDTLSTFKEVGNIICDPGSEVAFVLLAIKVSRLRTMMLKGGNIKDSIRDLINYAIYVECLYQEEQTK